MQYGGEMQTVILDGDRVSVPQEVFDWLMEFSREVSTCVDVIKGRVGHPDVERDALVRLAGSLVSMSPGPPHHDPDLKEAPHPEGEVSLWLKTNHADYTRLVYMLVDLPVVYGPTNGWTVNLRHALADVVRDDVDPSNREQVKAGALRVHTQSGTSVYSDAEAGEFADEYGLFVRRDYGRALLSGFLEWDLPSPGGTPWEGVEGR
jgi:hypothetical protein